MSDPGQASPDRVFRLIYRSHDLIPAAERKTALGELFSTARSHNSKHGLTGALLLSQDCFVQALEGDEAIVRALYAKITADPRHDDVTVLETTWDVERVFSRWAMARVADDGEHDIPLLANQRGITPAAPRASTEGQEALLALMRDAAGGLSRTS